MPLCVDMGVYVFVLCLEFLHKAFAGRWLLVVVAAAAYTSVTRQINDLSNQAALTHTNTYKPTFVG